ncbi:hypothetical protein [Hyphococcus sp.]|uniref:hypothetical protein n=1 Tax=Hyphococcus sp. TaxID=2038636 RepID=UPI003D0B865A
MTFKKSFPALARMAGAALALGVITTGFASAQEPRERPPLTDEQRAQMAERLEEIQTRLNLSEAQRTELEPVLRRNFEKRAEILKRYGVSKDGNSRLGFKKARALKNDLEKARKTNEAEVARILDERQMAEYRKIQEETREEFRQRMRERRS